MLTIYVNFNLLLAFFFHKLPTKYTQITHTHYWKNTPFTNLQYNAITLYITQLLTPHLQQHLTFLHTLTKLTYNIHINILKMYISFLISFIQHHIQRLKLFYTFVLCILLIFLPSGSMHDICMCHTSRRRVHWKKHISQKTMQKNY